MIGYNGKQYHCSMEMTIDIIGGKWKALILWNLAEGCKRFNELQRLLHGITQKMLTQQLRDLEKDGLVSRKIHDEIPPRVEYSLTEFGKTLLPVLYEMNNWGNEFMNSRESS